MISMNRSKPAARKLIHDCGGATIVEFAIVAPVLILFLMGSGDLLIRTYITSVLDGEVQKAGRDSTLQANSSSTATDAIDARVMTAVRKIASSATFVSSRQNYTEFGSVSKPEPFTDSNVDGIRQVGECYSDVNMNNQWDADQGISGEGGASDATLYTITVSYPHLFPVKGLFGSNGNVSITSKTLLMNQPYAAQSIVTPPSVCT